MRKEHHKIMVYRSNRYLYASVLSKNNVILKSVSSSNLAKEAYNKKNAAVCEEFAELIIKMIDFCKLDEKPIFFSKQRYLGNTKRLAEILRQSGFVH